MDIAAGRGVLTGAAVLATLIVTGVDLRIFADSHSAIVIFGGSFATNLIRFPLVAIFQGLPLGTKYAFTTMRRITQRDRMKLASYLSATKRIPLARKASPMST